MKYAFFGKTSYEKIQFLLILAKALKTVTDKKVVIITSNAFYKNEINPWEYEENILICNYSKENTVKNIFDIEDGYILFDVGSCTQKEKFISLGINTKNFIITNEYKEVIDYNLNMISNIDVDTSSNYHLIGYRLTEGSKVKEKILTEKYRVKKENSSFYYMNGKDNMLFINNSHNQIIRIKGLSKYFMQLLLEVLFIIVEVDENEVKEYKRIKKIIGKVK